MFLALFLVKFDVNLHPISLLDDMLLIICLPSFFLFGILQFAAAATNISGFIDICKAYHSIDSDPDADLSNPSGIMTMTKTIISLLQIMIQTPMIIDGLRRCSNTLTSQGKKT